MHLDQIQAGTRYGSPELSKIDNQMDRIKTELTNRGITVTGYTPMSITTSTYVTTSNNVFQKLENNAWAIGDKMTQVSDYSVEEWLKAKITFTHTATISQLNRWINYINTYSEEIGI